METIKWDDIAERAHQLWEANGGSADENWLEAERQLHDGKVSQRLTEINEEKGGSVQN